MGRKILAVVVGLVAAFAVIGIVAMIGTLVIAPPGPEIRNDPAKLREFISNPPVAAYVATLVGYFLGSFAGGYIVTKMSVRESPGIQLPLLIGVILTIGGILIFFVLLPGQPVWLAAASLVMYIPITLLGHKLAR